MTQMTDSFITQAEEVLADASGWLDSHRHHHSGRRTDVRRLIGALDGLLGEYKRLTTEVEWEYMARNRDYLRRGLSEDEALAWRARGYKVWKRTPGRKPGEWVPVEGEDQ